MPPFYLELRNGSPAEKDECLKAIMKRTGPHNERTMALINDGLAHPLIEIMRDRAHRKLQIKALAIVSDMLAELDVRMALIDLGLIDSVASALASTNERVLIRAMYCVYNLSTDKTPVSFHLMHCDRIFDRIVAITDNCRSEKLRTECVKCIGNYAHFWVDGEEATFDRMLPLMKHQLDTTADEDALISIMHGVGSRWRSSPEKIQV